MSARRGKLHPAAAVIALLLVLWISLATWAALESPFLSGTDESIRYVAFAAAKNRWATEADFKQYGIDHFYYPPLYFLVFAPLHGDNPAFTDGYPRGTWTDPFYLRGGRSMVGRDWLARVPRSLLLLYRQAKIFSVLCGLAALSAIVATLRLLFRGPAGWWSVLAGAAPVILLPQFLYYQTLCNNDALVNALGALAILGFTAGMRALEGGRIRRFCAWSVGMAACIGLGILTKMSALSLILLPLAAAAALFLHDRPGTTSSRSGRSLLLLAALLGIVFLAGGWWLAYQASLGDWTGTAAHRLAHPWGFRSWENALTPERFAREMVMSARFYLGIFSGPLIGIPDWAFAAYLLIPLVLLALCARGMAVALGRIARAPLPPGRPGLHRLLWLALAGTFLLNVVLFLLNNIATIAPYGRLLFVTLAASHALFGWVLTRGIRRVAPRRAAALALTAVLLGIFLWTFTSRMRAAVNPPAERLVLLSAISDGMTTVGPIWEAAVYQQLRLPPGRLRGFRVALYRPNMLPQFGATLAGELRTTPPNGPSSTVGLRPASVGDMTARNDWVDLPLAEAVSLPVETPALLRLVGRPSRISLGPSQVEYRLAEASAGSPLGPLRETGPLASLTLRISAVYE